jgi:hypothetical protein
MVFNDTTNKSGIIQSIEFWCGFQDGDISGDSTMLAIFTGRVNVALDRYFGMLGAGSRLSKIDDMNYSEHPFSYFDITTGINDYEFLIDEDGNSISDITAVLIKVGSSYKKLDKVTLDHPDAELIMSPNDKPGTPTRFLERNNTIFFDPVPNYTLAKGGKLFYKRVPSYFAITDTTKEPGIPTQFHEMIAIYVSYVWLLVHKPNSTVEISRVELSLNKYEDEFRIYNELRNPQANSLRPKYEKTR